MIHLKSYEQLDWSKLSPKNWNRKENTPIPVDFADDIHDILIELQHEGFDITSTDSNHFRVSGLVLAYISRNEDFNLKDISETILRLHEYSSSFGIHMKIRISELDNKHGWPHGPHHDFVDISIRDMIKKNYKVNGLRLLFERKNSTGMIISIDR